MPLFLDCVYQGLRQYCVMLYSMSIVSILASIEQVNTPLVHAKYVKYILLMIIMHKSSKIAKVKTGGARSS